MKKVGFHTLGCKVNQYETEAMEEMFKNNGYEVVDSEKFADIYVINTCTVTNISDRKSRQFIRRAKRNNEEAVVAVVGCYSQTSPEDIESIEEVDVILGTSNRDKIVSLCEQFKKDKKKINIVDDIKKQKEFEDINIENLSDMTRAYIKIQDGCNMFCSYCIIPYARGPIRSRDMNDILDEVRVLVDSGYKEIILTGIHVASYGKDLKNGEDLKVLIKRLSEIDKLERIRFSSLEPRLIDDEFMKVLVDSKKACDHFHLSIQSGSDTVLNRMNRKYNTDEFKDIVSRIRKYMPDAGITTDIIVGFPGESNEEFEETLELVKDIKFSRLHVFKYSPREGTPAANMKNQIDGNIKNERSTELIKLGDEIEKEFISNFIGETVSVLVEETVDDNQNYMEGYTTNYIRVRTDLNEDYLGKLIDIKIEKEDSGILIGNMIK